MKQPTLAAFKFSVLAAAIALGLSACGGGSSSTTTSTTPSTSTTTPSTTTTPTTPTTTTTTSYTISGTVSGLTGSGLVLANGTDTVSVPSGATTFTFTNPVASGGAYAVTVQTQPSGESCTVSNGSGTANSTVSNVTISCGATASPVVFSQGFTGSGTTIDGGAVNGYGGSNEDGYNCNGTAQWCGGGSSAGTSAATSSEYFYYQTPTPATGEYVGLGVFAPNVKGYNGSGNTSGVTLSGQKTLTFTFNSNPEWATQGTPNIMVELTMGNYYTVAGGAACRIQLQDVIAATGGATATSYTVPLSDFIVAQNCGVSGMTVAQALTQPIASIDFQGDAGASAITAGVGKLTTNANTTVVTSGGVYPTTLALTGPITFQ